MAIRISSPESRLSSAGSEVSRSPIESTTPRRATAVGHVLSDAAQPHHRSRRPDGRGGSSIKPPDLAVRTEDTVFLFEGPTGGDAVLQRGPHRGLVVAVDAGDVRLERPVEFERIDALDTVQLIGPLHRAGPHVPQPPAHVSECFAVANPGLDLGERRLGEQLLSDIPCDHRRGDEASLPVHDRSCRQRDRRRHAVLALNLCLEMADPVAAGHAREERGDVAPQVLGEQRGRSFTDDLRLAVAKDPLCAPVPAGDPSVQVEAENGVVGCVQEGLQEGESDVHRPGSGFDDPHAGAVGHPTKTHRLLPYPRRRRDYSRPPRALLRRPLRVRPPSAGFWRDLPACKAGSMSQPTAAGALAPLFHAVLGDELQLEVRFWAGSRLGPRDSPARVDLRSPDAVRRILWSPNELGFGRAYVLGEADIEGDAFTALALLAREAPAELRIGTRTLLQTLRAARRLGIFGPPLPPPAEEIRLRGGLHSRRRDAAAVSHHYDVGNDFYRLLLGESMTYSCARFTDPSDTLEMAQAAKYDLICRKLGLRPGMRLLDVGCGWGGMVMHAAAHYQVAAVGITLSEQQYDLARKRVAEAGLSDWVEIRLQDYRDVGTSTNAERYDAISSIGMFEHVGAAQISAYFKALTGVLAAGGRLLNHAISTPDGAQLDRRTFIARYVFPDGELQDVAAVVTAMEAVDLEVRDVESLREHYPLTLRRWSDNLEANWDEAVALVGAVRA